MATRGRHIHTDEAHNAANAGAYEQHGHKKARCNGTAGSPHRSKEVHHQHCEQRGVAKLPVGSSGQQVLDGILACRGQGRVDCASMNLHEHAG